MEGIFLLLGSNLGNRVEVLKKAIEILDSKGVRVLARSSVYETAAWGKTDQQNFLNQVLRVCTRLSAAELLQQILTIEAEMGRVRKEKWGERLIDIDILYYHDHVYREDNLEVPHPKIPVRRFTLVPLVELQPDFVHPSMRLTQLELLRKCEDVLEVSVYRAF